MDDNMSERTGYRRDGRTLSRRAALRTGGAALAGLPFVTSASGAPVTSIESGQTYRIESVHSGRVLDVSGISQANGANVHQWEYVGGANQHWTVEDVGGGAYRLVADHSGKVLDVRGVSQDNGATLHQWDWVDGANQKFYIDHQGNGEFFVMPTHSEKVLDVENWSTRNGGDVQQWLWHDQANQRWRFHPVGSGGGGGGGSDGGGSNDYPGLDDNTWDLAWSDEFDQGYVDTNNWSHEVGGGCGQGGRHDTDCTWGNNEEQYYTDGDNAWVENGRLVIEAREELAPNGTNPYTSARLNTAGKFEKQYGRIDVRARLPAGQGLWPAIWLLGHDIGSVGWPQCGELDIMELLGDEPNTVHGSMHGPGYSGGNSRTAAYTGPDFTGEFHDFQLTWYPDAVKWFVDGNHYNTVTRPEVENAGLQWVFEDEFFIILNVAVGGNFPGYPDWSTQFPQRMEVEHVRVYDWV